MKSVLHFKDVATAEIESLGGKGKNLVLLTQRGFPVPPGAVLFSHAYRNWLHTIRWFSPDTHQFSYDQPDQLHRQASELQSRLRTEVLPKETADQLRQLLTAWPQGTAFAVRSSSTFEDLGEAAFAGQHDTYLNCVGADDIIEKVRECWISLWTDRALLYRYSRGFAHSDAAMAVVIQQQIACDVAGVAFSIHPVTGHLQTVAIDANYGLGESVVSGEFPVDHFEVDAKDFSLAASIIAEKTSCIAPQSQGTAEIQLPEAKRNIACLEAQQIIEVAKLARTVAAYYSWPQDIEWGFANGKLHLLQARPVTSIPPRWTRDESAERWPQAVTPLSWDYIDTAFRKSLSCSLQLMGLPVIQSTWFERLGYHVYGNQNAVELIRGYKPFEAQNIQELMSEIPKLRERYAALIELPSIWMRDLDRYLLRIGALRAVRIENLNAREVWEYTEQVAQTAEEYFLPNIAISMTQGFLHGVLHQILKLIVGPEKAIDAMDGLLSGVDCKTVEVNRELFRLSRILLRDSALCERLARDGSLAVIRTNGLSSHQEFCIAFQQFLDLHGHREQLMDYSSPTWCDAPEVVLDLIRSIPLDAEQPAALMRAARQKFTATEFAVLAAIPESLRFFIKELIRLARLYTALDDLEHYQTTRVNPLARRGALVLGQLFKDQGVLASATDIFFLRHGELAELIAGSSELTKTAKATAATRRAEYERANSSSPAWVYGEQEVEVFSEKALHGIPGSPGSATGKCFLITNGNQFKDFPQGAILVARTTNPTWTPLFYRASGIVTESGGPLSHGAVTAREMKLPAVMAVRGVMERLKNGQRIIVNGSKGMVELLDD